MTRHTLLSSIVGEIGSARLSFSMLGVPVEYPGHRLFFASTTVAWKKSKFGFTYQELSPHGLLLLDLTIPKPEVTAEDYEAPWLCVFSQ